MDLKGVRPQTRMVPRMPNAFSRTAPLLTQPYDLYKLQQRVIKMQDTIKKRTEVNSFLDLVTNIGAYKKTMQGKWYEDIPIMNALFAGAEMTMELAKKSFDITKPGQSLMNILYNVGETLDAVALLVKAPLYAWSTQGKVSVLEAYSEAYGLSERGQTVINFEDISKNVDWMPNNFATNLVGEILVDPINWMTFGAYALGKKSLLTGTKGVSSFFKVNQKVGNAIISAIDIAKKTNADDILEAAFKSLKGTIGVSDDLLRHGIKYAINQSSDIAKISSLSAKNIGGYLHRLNAAAFRNDAKLFEKIIRSNPTDMLMPKPTLRKLFEEATTVTRQHKAIRFMYAVDEAENAVIKKLWQSTPIGLGHSLYKKYASRPLVKINKVIEGIQKSNSEFNILEETGFSTKTYQALRKEYNSRLKEIRKAMIEAPENATRTIS